MIEEITGRQRIRPVVTPREHIVRYIRYLPWLVISVAIMLVAAYIKLRYSIPIYNVSGKLLVSAQMLGGGNDKFDDIFSMQALNAGRESTILTSGWTQIHYSLIYFAHRGR